MLQSRNTLLAGNTTPQQREATICQKPAKSDLVIENKRRVHSKQHFVRNQQQFSDLVNTSLGFEEIPPEK